jgi:hypothetical protein
VHEEEKEEEEEGVIRSRVRREPPLLQ